MDASNSEHKGRLSRRAAPLVAAAAVLVGLAAVRSPAVGLVLASMSLAAFASFLMPNVATYLVLFLLYSNLGAVSVAFHGVPKPVAAAFPLLLAIPLTRDIVVRREPFVVTPVLLLLVIYAGVQGVGMAFSIDSARSGDAFLTLIVEGVVLYLLITNAIRTTEVLRGVTWALLGAGLLMSVVPLFQQFTRTFDRNYGGLAQVDSLGFRTGETADEGGELRQARLAGPIGEKNRYAQVLLGLVPLGLMRFWGERSRLLRWVALGSTALISLGFVLAFSRGGFVGLMAVVAAMVAMRLIDLRRMVVVCMGVGMLFIAMPQYWSRISSIGSTLHLFNDEADSAEEPDGAMKRRVTEMMAAVRVFIDHPVIGVGPGMFKAYSEEYGNIDALRKIESGRRAHCLYLEIAAENGAFGLALFVAMLLMTMAGLAAARRRWAVEDPELANLATAYLLALFSYMVTGVFLHLSYMRYFYVLLALGGAACHLAYVAERRERPVPLTLEGAPA